VAASAPIDAFGVGTELATSGDAPSRGAIYKLVEIDGRDKAKWSQDKISMPGAKQLFRFRDRDVLALAEESCPPGAQALLRPVILKGQLVEAAPGLEAIRDYAAESLRACAAAPRQVEHSSALAALMDRVKAEQK
jgi:nicotinate phosphoribosyltransferase